MKMSDIKDAAWACSPHPVPTKVVPDFAALFHDLDTRGWLLVEPPPEDHRLACNGVVESKLVKDFKNWMINNKRLMLSHRRVGEHRWYIAIGAPCMSSQQSRKAKEK